MSRYTAVISSLYEIEKKAHEVVAKGGPKSIDTFARDLLQKIVKNDSKMKAFS